MQRCSAPGLARIAESRNMARAACATPYRASEWADRLSRSCAHVQATKDLLQKKFATGKNRWFFQKLRF